MFCITFNEIIWFLLATKELTFLTYQEKNLKHLADKGLITVTEF